MLQVTFLLLCASYSYWTPTHNKHSRTNGVRRCFRWASYTWNLETSPGPLCFLWLCTWVTQLLLFVWTKSFQTTFQINWKVIQVAAHQQLCSCCNPSLQRFYFSSSELRLRRAKSTKARTKVPPGISQQLLLNPGNFVQPCRLILSFLHVSAVPPCKGPCLYHHHHFPVMKMPYMFRTFSNRNHKEK